MRCRAANAAAAHTRVPFVPAAAVCASLAQLVAQGLGTRQIARLTGVARSTICALVTSPPPTVRASTAQKLAVIATLPPTVANGALVKATKAWRAIDSLQREGYTRRTLAWHLGLHSQQLQLAHPFIRQSTARKLAALHHQLADA